ncbi:MAG: hypothetical protein ABSE73_14320 [Planctomycetota bacterium]
MSPCPAAASFPQESRKGSAGLRAGGDAGATISDPAGSAELAGRLVIAGCLAALLYALWFPGLEGAAAWTAKELRVLPRLSVFALGALTALLVQGARPGRRFLLGGGLLAAAASVWWLQWAESGALPVGRPNDAASTLGSLEAAGSGAAHALMLSAGPVVQLLRFEAALLSAVLLGTWLGRGIQSSPQLVAMLFCAIAGDVWLNTFHVAETAGPDHPLRLLRLPWPPALGHLSLSPAFSDLLFLSATLEAAGRLRFHTLAVVLGAAAGYCAGSFLGLVPRPSLPALSMAMLSSGVLVGCWPDLKCSAREAGRAVLLAAVLMAALLAIAALQRMLTPAPQPQPGPARSRFVACALVWNRR